MEGGVLLMSHVHTIQKARKRKHGRSNHLLESSSCASSNSQVRGARHRRWSPGQKYTLFKEGALGVVRKDHIARMHEQGQLRHEHLHYFVHGDARIQRADRIEPKWVVALRVGPQDYVLPQQPYLTCIYKRLGRVSDKQALTLLEDGTPYWVDTYIARVRRDKAAKRKYSQRMRAQKKRQKKE